MKRERAILIIVGLLVLLFSYNTVSEIEAQAELGTLELEANGEDFVRQGFVSKDGWQISFEHVYLNLSDIMAYQTNPPFSPDEGGEPQAEVAVGLEGSYVVDLAEGDETAEPLKVGEISAPAGQYNALSWKMTPAAEGEMAGYSLLMVGTAQKEGETVDFSLGVDRGYESVCGEFVGDERKGILEAGGVADQEMTFHFDHIFGDEGVPADDGLNTGAVGFEPFVALAEGGQVETDLAGLEAELEPEAYQMLIDILPTLAHTGEGHCLYKEPGTLEIEANGEDFVRHGFVSKDGWQISFDHVYLNLDDITAYQTNPPFSPDEGGEPQAEVTVGLEGSYVVDLAEGDETAEPLKVGEISAPAGQYNALSWKMTPATEGEMAGYSLLMVGTAQKEGETIDFRVGVERGYESVCGEFVGDERKGILEAGGVADQEMTFHFDHIFGDEGVPADDGLNTGAVGFEPFVALADGGQVETDLAGLEAEMEPETYQMLIDILPTLAHTGEGHCLYEELGTLELEANGEDFVRQGFVSKDGWQISFENVYLNLDEITAYQTNPPFEPAGNTGLSAEAVVGLEGSYVVDLAEGDETAEPLKVGEVLAPAGQYNALSWKMTPAAEGEMAGYSLLMVGTAQKEDESIDFRVGIENEYPNICGEFVGDDRKGILEAGGVADQEMTFHFDHIFGDEGVPADDGLNTGAVGFEPFVALAEGGQVETDLAGLETALTPETYQMLIDILPTLGHTGEGHCLYKELGTLELEANGEDFVRQGFVSKDGWQISFENVFVNLSDIMAYQTNPPFSPDEGGEPQAEVTVGLEGSYVVDLAEGDETAEPLKVGEISAPAGQYNALSWKMTPAVEGEMAGYSLLMVGTAQKEGETIDFRVGVEDEYSNVCGEFVGDERKGILTPEGVADQEMTFHFDHIFGDEGVPADDGLNTGAVGFEPFVALAEGGQVETDLAGLEAEMEPETYQMLIDILPTLAHTGEGHCLYN